MAAILSRHPSVARRSLEAVGARNLKGEVPHDFRTAWPPDARVS
jgi:hypothetical protein